MSFQAPSIDLSQKFSLYDIELNDLGDQFQSLVNEIRSSSRDDRVEKISTAKNILEQCKKTYQKLGAASKKETDDQKKQDFIHAKDKHKNQITKFKGILSQVMSEVEQDYAKHQRTDDLRAQLLGSSMKEGSLISTTPGKLSSSPIPQDIGKTMRVSNKAYMEKQVEEQKLQIQLERELFKDVFEAQKESMDILDRLNQKVEQSTNIAIESGEILRQQREDLYEIDRQLDELGGNTKRARNELSTILRRLAADKFLLVLAILVVVAILIFILVSIGLSIYNRVSSRIK